MNIAYNLPRGNQNLTNGKKTVPNFIQPNMPDTFKPTTKFWGIWLPVPTILAIINSLFWTWLIINTVGFTVDPIEKASEKIIEQF